MKKIAGVASFGDGINYRTLKINLPKCHEDIKRHQNDEYVVVFAKGFIKRI